MASAEGPPHYKLLAVLSHVGHFGSGHYVSYVRPVGRSQWIEFDDTRVSAVAERVAVRGQFGATWRRRIRCGSERASGSTRSCHI